MNRLFQAIKGSLAAVAVGLNVVVIFAAMIPFALVKLLVPARAVRRVCDRALTAIAIQWVAINDLIPDIVGRTRWDVQGVEGLHRRGWYLVSANHQAWADILVLQRVFRGRIPFLKFFLKEELKWVPVIGLAWWALDFPFMKRGKKGGRSAGDHAPRLREVPPHPDLGHQLRRGHALHEGQARGPGLALPAPPEAARAT